MASVDLERLQKQVQDLLQKQLEMEKEIRELKASMARGRSRDILGPDEARDVNDEDLIAEDLNSRKSKDGRKHVALPRPKSPNRKTPEPTLKAVVPEPAGPPRSKLTSIFAALKSPFEKDRVEAWRKSEEALEHCEEWEPELSVWNAVLLVKSPVASPVASVMLILASLGTCLMQVVFIYLIGTGMAADPLPTEMLQELLRFRLGPGHDVRYADLNKQLSLTRRMCGHDEVLSALPIGRHEAELLKDLEEYWNAGKIITVLAIIMWLGVIFRELSEIWCLFRAILSLERGKTTFHMRPKHVGLEVSIESFSTVRLVLTIVLNVIPRTILAISLGFVGTNYIIYNLDLKDLIKDAIVLQYILEIPEVLFSVLCPDHIKTAMKDLEPLQIKKTALCKAMHRGWDVFLKLALATLVVLLVFFLQIEPFFTRIHLAQDIMCSGNQDFVFATNPLSNVVTAGTLLPDTSGEFTSIELASFALAGLDPSIYDLDFPDLSSDTMTAIAQKGPVFVDILPAGGAWMNASTLSVDDLQQLTVYESGDSMKVVTFGICADLVPNMAADRFKVLRDVTGLPGNKCSAFAAACGWRNASVVRWQCPSTCNCDNSKDPLWPGILVTSTYGCPTACEGVKDSWIDTRWTPGNSIGNFSRNPPCGDKPDFNVTTVPTLATYLYSVFDNIVSKPMVYDSTMRLLSEFGSNYGATTQQQRVSLATSLLNGTSLQSLLAGRWEFAPGFPATDLLSSAGRGKSDGCIFLTSSQVTALWQMDLCAAGEFRSIREYCPYSCGCIGNSPECPNACQKIIPVIGATLMESPAWPPLFKNLSNLR